LPDKFRKLKTHFDILHPFCIAYLTICKPLAINSVQESSDIERMVSIQLVQLLLVLA